MNVIFISDKNYLLKRGFIQPFLLPSGGSINPNFIFKKNLSSLKALKSFVFFQINQFFFKPD